MWQTDHWLTRAALLVDGGVEISSEAASLPVAVM
jgi:hypothetical protein